jgi:hypothetical protein
MVEDREQLTNVDADKCYYLGLDVSLNHLGMAFLSPQGKFLDYYFITSVKKEANAHLDHSTYYNAPSARSDHPLHYKRVNEFLDVVHDVVRDFYDVGMDFVGNPTLLCCVEGYAVGTKSSRLFETAELTGSIKNYLVYEQEYPLRVHDPDSVKLFAVGNGHAKKEDVYRQFVQETEVEIYYKQVKRGTKKDFDGPGTDVADAYFLARLTWMEMQLRKGRMSLQDMPENWVRVVNRVTKTYPTNLLDRPFVVRL